MPAASAQRTSRGKVTLDNAAVADLSFFTEQNRTKKHRAAILLAEDELSDEAIAKELRISRTTLWEWKQHPEFQQVMGDYRGRIIADALKLPIAKRHERVKRLNDLHDKALQVIEDRAARYRADLETDDPISATRKVFGHNTPAEAATGLMVRQETANTTGKVTVNWTFDRSLVAEIREIEKQAAQELGQWSDKSEVTTDGGLRVEIVGIADEDMP